MTHLPPVITTPHEWEGARGADSLERTAALGRDARDFARRNNLAQVPTDNWRGVASLGKESLRLLSNKARHERGKEDIRAAAADRQEDAPAEEDNDSETESSDGEDEELDTEHANKVLDEDWDTSTWTPPEIEAACETLINVRMGLGGARSILTLSALCRNAKSPPASRERSRQSGCYCASFRAIRAQWNMWRRH